MRTQQRDQNNFTITGASVADAASGSGVMQPGNIPFVYTRTSTGQYTVNFDVRLLPVHVESVGQIGASPWAVSNGWGSGFINFITVNTSGAAANSGFKFTVTAIDKRT